MRKVIWQLCRAPAYILSLILRSWTTYSSFLLSPHPPHGDLSSTARLVYMLSRLSPHSFVLVGYSRTLRSIRAPRLTSFRDVTCTYAVIASNLLCSASPAACWKLIVPRMSLSARASGPD